MAKKKTKKSKATPPALKKMQELWKGGEPRKALGPLPDGTYQATITDSKIGATQKKKRQIDTTLEVISGEFEGRTIHKYDMLETQDNVDWVQGMLEILELDVPDSIGDLEDTLKDAIGKIVEISVRNSEGFTNVYINDLLEEIDDSDEDEDEEDDDEPDDDDEEEDDEEEGEDEDEDEDDDDEEEEEEEDDEEEDEDDEEEEEEEEPPKKKKSAKKKAKAKKKKGRK